MGIAGRNRAKYLPTQPFLATFSLEGFVCSSAYNRNGGSSLNSPMYKELSSDEEEDYPSLFVPDIPTASQSPSHGDDDEFTPNSTGSTSRKSIPKKKKMKDPSETKPSKPRKPRVPKNPSDSPSKTHVNRFKKSNFGEMVRTVSDTPLGGGSASAMARVSSFLRCNDVV